MEIREQLEKYIPFNEQEVKNKEMMLKYMNMFDDLLTRENEILHFTSSGFILNETRDKVLMIHHNIYNSWAWTGGHADGEENLLDVAIREAKEETGIKAVKPIVEDVFTIDILTVDGHIKRGKYVSSHLHVSFAYLLEASEQELIRIKEDENSNVKWLPIETFLDFITEEHMKPIYAKMVD